MAGSFSKVGYIKLDFYVYLYANILKQRIFFLHFFSRASEQQKSVGACL